MDQIVEIPVEIRGVERVFEARVHAWQYGMQFFIDIDGVEVMLERDDAGAFRAILPAEFTDKPPDKEIIGAIIDVLESL